jgi:anti-sigma factor RsiW
MIAHADAEILSAYLDGELAASERRETEMHLAGCPACRARFESLGRAVASLRRLERAAPPAVLAQHVQRRIALAGSRAGVVDRLEERLRGLGSASPLLTSFAVILALASIVYLFAHGVDRHQRHSVPIVVPNPEAARQLDEAIARIEPATKRAGGRLFIRTGDRWLERGLERAEAAGTLAPAVTAAESPAGRELLTRLPWLADLLAGGGGGGVVFRDGEAVVELRGPPPATAQ